MSREFDEFVAAIRRTVAPVAHLTDAELAAPEDLSQPLRRLLLGLRENLRDYDAVVEADRAFGQPHRGHDDD
jgi:hypothetical protein